MKRGKDKAGVILSVALSIVLHAGVAFVDIGKPTAKTRGESEILTVSLLEMPTPATLERQAASLSFSPLPAQPLAEVAAAAIASLPAAKPSSAKKSQKAASKEETIKLEPLKSVPDPLKEGGEVTLSLGEVDTRYKGFLDRVRSAVDLSWNWREALLAAGKPGKVTVRMTLTPAGRASASVVSSSGSPALDRETVATVGRAQMPAFPEEWTITRLNLIADFEYSYGN